MTDFARKFVVNFTTFSYFTSVIAVDNFYVNFTTFSRVKKRARQDSLAQRRVDSGRD